MTDTAVTAGSTGRSSGVDNFSSGSFTGAATTTTTITLGFKPRYFKVLTVTGVITWEKTQDMPAANALKTVTAGTLTYDTGSNVLFTGNTVVLTATVAVSGDVICWWAMG